jgi:hypothetical protein
MRVSNYSTFPTRLLPYFLDYFKTLSATRLYSVEWCRITDERWVRRDLKGSDSVLIKVISWHLPSRSEKNRGRAQPVPAEIQTEHLPTTSQELYRCANYFHIAVSFPHFSLTRFGNFKDKYSSKMLRSSTTEHFSPLVNIKALFYWVYFMCWVHFRRRTKCVSSEHLALPHNAFMKGHWGCHGSGAVAISFINRRGHVWTRLQCYVTRTFHTLLYYLPTSAYVFKVAFFPSSFLTKLFKYLSSLMSLSSLNTFYMSHLAYPHWFGKCSNISYEHKIWYYSLPHFLYPPIIPPSLTP